MIDANVRSTIALSVGVLGRAGWSEIPNREQAEENVPETKTLPWSMTMVSGMMIGFAAACSSRASTATRRSCGSTELAMDRVRLQPGRMGSGTSIRASSTAASTPLVPAGRSRAAQIVRVATSTAIVSSGRATTPSSSTAMMSRRVESICTISPGRAARDGVNGPVGLRARCRRAVAVPDGSLPLVSLFTNR
ncbi:hypothetical protein [Streptomyces sp. NPDC058451]|uniref:hypothetical protein n=1 Tax=Streptomyces sp. NPDC058451 TaxID=3346506 RepID=UPI003663762C